jgi:hypothetical protein
MRSSEHSSGKSLGLGIDGFSAGDTLGMDLGIKSGPNASPVQLTTEISVSEAVAKFHLLMKSFAGPEYRCQTLNVRGTQSAASICSNRIFDRIGDAAQLYFAFFQNRVGGRWITVLELADASRIDFNAAKNTCFGRS